MADDQNKQQSKGNEAQNSKMQEKIKQREQKQHAVQNKKTFGDK